MTNICKVKLIGFDDGLDLEGLGRGEDWFLGKWFLYLTGNIGKIRFLFVSFWEGVGIDHNAVGNSQYSL